MTTTELAAKAREALSTRSVSLRAGMIHRIAPAKKHMVNVICPECGRPRQVSRAASKKRGFTGICGSCSRAQIEAGREAKKKAQSISAPCGQMIVPAPGRCSTDAPVCCEHYEACLWAVPARWEGWRVA